MILGHRSHSAHSVAASSPPETMSQREDVERLLRWLLLSVNVLWSLTAAFPDSS